GVDEAVEVECRQLPADAGVRGALVTGHRVAGRPHEEVERAAGRVVEDADGAQRPVDGVCGHRLGLLPAMVSQKRAKARKHGGRPRSPRYGRAMPRHVRLREFLVGVEGLALIRHLLEGEDATAAARLDEGRRIVDSGDEATGGQGARSGRRGGGATPRSWTPARVTPVGRRRTTAPGTR